MKYLLALRKPALLLLLMIAALALLAACQPLQPASSTVPPAPASSDEIPPEGRVVPLWVGPERVTCTGVVEMQCLQVKWTEDGPWENFYSGIDGFFYVPGYNYELLVRETNVDPVPADGSSIAYSLEQVVSRTPDYTGEPLPLLGTDWRLISFGEHEIVAFDPAVVEVTALFTDTGVSGSSGCNSYTGGFTYDADLLVVSDLATTRMMCAEEAMAVETAFLRAFVGEHQYQIDGNKLEIIYAAGELIFQGE